MPIDYRKFIYPDDASSLNALRGFPGFDKLTKKFMELFGEKIHHIEQMSSYLKLGPKQMPEIYNMLPPICEKLGIKEPDLYLRLDREVNAYTIGDTNVSIVINSGLIETLSLDEVKTVLAHECGHILCRHCLYTTMAQWILNASTSLLSSYGLLSLASVSLKLAFYQWLRSSEFSADRVAAYVRGGSDKVVDLLMTFSGATKNLGIKPNKELFLQQAKGYKEEIKNSKYNKFLEFYIYAATMDHPLNAYRAHELNEWCKTDQFKEVIKHIDLLPENFDYDTARKTHLDKANIDLVDKKVLESWFDDRKYLNGEKHILVHCGIAEDGEQYIKNPKKIDKNKVIYQCMKNKDENIVAHRLVTFKELDKHLEKLFEKKDGYIEL